MATSKLTLYKGALRILGQASITALTDAVENRRLLDEAYDENAIGFTLEQGNWNFAIRTIEINYDTSVSDPGFSFSRAFSKPSDWKKTVRLASDEYFTNPMTHREFNDEQQYWWADIDTIYVQYVSDDSSYGSDLSVWTQAFVNYFEAYLASQIVHRVFQSEADVKKVFALAQNALEIAKSNDAWNEGAKFHAPGGWASARRGRGGGHRDRGSRSNLTG